MTLEVSQEHKNRGSDKNREWQVTNKEQSESLCKLDTGKVESRKKDENVDVESILGSSNSEKALGVIVASPPHRWAPTMIWWQKGPL